MDLITCTSAGAKTTKSTLRRKSEGEGNGIYNYVPQC